MADPTQEMPEREAVAPALYVRPPMVERMTVPRRIVAAAIAAACLGVLLIALWLKPEPSGIGSHRQLGLDACQFEARTGVPCATCGMTTSFAHFARGQLLASLYVQPMGTMLALAAAMTTWAGGFIALTGRPAHRLLRFVPVRYYLVPFFGGFIVAWGWKIYIHLRGAGGWG